LYRIPLLMLISYRGEFGERDPWQTEGGGVTEDLLRALRIPFAYLDDPSHVAHRMRKAQTLAQSANRPVALLLCRDLMWEEDATTASEQRERASGAEGAASERRCWGVRGATPLGSKMTRADALAAIYPQLEDAVVVTIMGAVAAE